MRTTQEGMLLQIDVSYHRWLGEGGLRFALLFAVDDATGTVPAALFGKEEDTRGYLLLMEELVRRHGIFKRSREAQNCQQSAQRCKTECETHIAAETQEGPTGRSVGGASPCLLPVFRWRT